MTTRAHISLRVKLASALAELQYLRGDPIPWEQLKAMSADELLSLYSWDHGELHAFTANDHFSNLTPRLILAHREKSREDTKKVAKSKRIAKKQAQHLTRMTEKLMAVDVRGARDDSLAAAAKRFGMRLPGERPKRKWPSGPMQSRPFQKLQTRPR